ncbi:two-component system sensor kinase FixL [Rhizomicrobium palustre]|uniref:histidine kinase n=1 Tax=Rhizomicrobium palustre TaxID=189966 RepID=A0A846MZ52_9PROT|nr:PAS domain-containing sensor histidine kinase [Rhizomicrobium palustre]NIK88908.1 two-component system sensor kinase FixL [Rhizomicrobium palustre]
MATALSRLTPWNDSLFETVVAAAVNGMAALNDQGLVQLFNSAAEAMFQVHREEILGRSLPMLLAPAYRDAYEAAFIQFRATGELSPAVVSREVEGQRKNGTTFPVFLSLGQGQHEGKRILVVVFQDLSALQGERAIHSEERAFLAAIVDSSNDAIVSKTLDGRITSWNRAAQTMFGYTAAEMIGSSITRLFPEDRLSEEADILERIRDGETVEHYETVRLKSDGTPLEVSITISPIRNAFGQVIGASKTVRDISEQKASEARLQTLLSELQHVARLSEMGQVSAALAHELNQPLSAVMNYTNLAKRLITSGAPADKAMEAVTKAGEQALRAGSIIRHLRDFVGKRNSNRTLEDINAVADEALVLGLMGAQSIDIHVNFRPDLPPVLIDKIQIQQVLVNLLRNASEAMAQSPQRDLTLSTARHDDGAVLVRVYDTGSGVPEAVAQRLFLPFVTTKPSGMGIGLAISRTIIESHGGRLSMSPNPAGGTIFQFTLPPAASLTE